MRVARSSSNGGIANPRAGGVHRGDEVLRRRPDGIGLAHCWPSRRPARHQSSRSVQKRVASTDAHDLRDRLPGNAGRSS